MTERAGSGSGQSYTGNLLYAKHIFKDSFSLLLYIANFYFLGNHPRSVEWNIAKSRDSQSLSPTPKLSPRRRKLTVLAKLSFSSITVTTAGENKKRKVSSYIKSVITPL